MAQPTNTYDSYDMNGIREDLSDIIHNISPDETPFYSKCGKTTAKNTFHEWQTDALRSSASNAHIEGDETTADAMTATTRLGNYTQIFKNAVTVPDTDQGLDKAGRAREMGYQTLKVAKEQKLDIEAALFDNNARVAGNSTTARELAGVPSWVVTNSSIGATGTAATGDGTDAHTPGTDRPFTQALFDTQMQNVWTSGGNPDCVYLSASHMDTALGFSGNNNQRSTIKAESEKVINHMDVYVTPWGTVQFIPSREIVTQPAGADADYVFIAQDDKWKVAVLRATKNTPLAKTGDSTKRQVVTELTLESCNEAASAAIYDLS